MIFFYQPEISIGIHSLNEEESRHCIRVLRHKKGDIIHVLDGKGSMYNCELTATDPKKVTFSVHEIHTSASRSYHLHLGIAPTKNTDRIEWLVEKSIEIGIDEITFLNCDHSERKRLNLTRIRKKAITALKQSGNLHLPLISDIIPFDKFINQDHDTSSNFLCNAEKGADVLKNIAVPDQKYVVLVGPEGDFSDEELQQAETSGFLFVSLGRSRLRTETAGLVVCSQLQMINM